MFGYISSAKGYYYVKIIEEKNDYFIGYSKNDKKIYIFKKEYFIEEF